MFNKLVSEILIEHTVLEEGIFSLPRRIFQDIIDYYSEIYQHVKTKNIKKYYAHFYDQF